MSYFLTQAFLPATEWGNLEDVGGRSSFLSCPEAPRSILFVREGQGVSFSDSGFPSGHRINGAIQEGGGKSSFLSSPNKREGGSLPSFHHPEPPGLQPSSGLVVVFNLRGAHIWSPKIWAPINRLNKKRGTY